MTFRKLTFLILFIYLVHLQSVTAQSKSQYWKFKKIPEWSDHFTGNKIDSSKWTFETGGDGWGNNELQYYTNGENAMVVNGVLKIIAEKKNKNNKDYTSSRIITKNKACWQYGRVEIRAKLPSGKGTWAAFWMLPVKHTYGSGTASGEIDIMEHVGFDPGKIHFSLHTQKYNAYLKNEKTSYKKISTTENKFHVYRLDWTSYGIRGYIDGKKYFQYMKNKNGFEYWPFDKCFFLIINLAIGGIWGGEKGIDDKIFPAIMEIDYVKVYEFLK